jgi:hypothetical protein
MITALFVQTCHTALRGSASCEAVGAACRVHVKSCQLSCHRSKVDVLIQAIGQLHQRRQACQAEWITCAAYLHATCIFCLPIAQHTWHLNSPPPLQAPKQKQAGAGAVAAPEPISGFTALAPAPLASWYRALWDALLGQYQAVVAAAHAALKATKVLSDAQVGTIYNIIAMRKCDEAEACATGLGTK